MAKTKTQKRKSIKLNHDLIYQVELLSDKQAGQLIKGVFEYMSGLEPVFNDQIISIVFVGIKQSIDSQPNNFGEGHWNWKEGISSKNKLIRNGIEIKEWRKEVFERDKYTCQNCFVKGGILHAHHVLAFAKYSALRFDINNGLTLCKSCHNKVHRKNG